MKLSGQIVLPDRILPGCLSFEGRIDEIVPDTSAPERYILPGFIDGHVHGGDGADTMDGVEAIHHLSRYHMAHGTTTILPTTITRPWADVMSALHAVAEVCRTGIKSGPRVHGVHLEGPFVSPHKLGAQPPFAISPSPERVAEALATGVVRVVTLAPELEHAETAIPAFAGAGVRVSLGHTVTDYDGAMRAICAVCAAGGTVGATHLFNAMAPVEGRRPGPVTALMCSEAAYAEMIYDTHHVHPASFRLAHRVMGSRLLFVTDAMRGAGMPEGPSQLGGQDVMIRDGAVRLPGGSLAGSVLTLDVALRNALKSGGMSLPQAAALVSTNAARYLGLYDRGTVSCGLRADLVVLNRDFHVDEVWVGGQRTV
ncbi:N-acetylglucosamine-6-phosphate deacetylase [Acetobacter oeni]|uniref:N-acetylglucosamine-6-phosphate deacetylase n=1 Tax=Acetobacter oeni TaxID=304077 RepID=A0A511XIZ4_9PROT|nr:N-acetylglucosamine-6-phosphate deacetylase [Acetobacter oeni]MBB3882661.1 N-acetylglucosamine-6-phosphate deacetylase [Acetobacter oeni]NHO18763.1 N-acetylglucosamine-6-phosphate deacetylase [Acetobacter oeni]GBR06553.1 N-acetylglucosamine-6-phosphate deacetylase [Acetobacter oeni LMG 21952]GEN62916.1 N-acetylglucosamine-6-phosphate deacetylase [Acetobacter oeni]